MMSHFAKLLVVLCVTGMLGATAAAQPTIVVWPRAPETDSLASAELDGVIRAAGFVPANAAFLHERLGQFAKAGQAEERAVLDRAQTAFAAARSAYLEQRFDDMLIALANLEGDALDVLVRPAHRGVLWEVQFQLGLAYMARGGQGDRVLARQRFARALSIDPVRRPDTTLYSPDVATEFQAAVAERSALVARPVRILATPSDARVVIDGVEIVSPDKAGNLVPGSHYVFASAPGYMADGFEVPIQADGTIRVPLRRIEAVDPIDRLGPAWALGDLRAHTRSGQAIIWEVMAALGGDVAVIVDAPSGRGTASATVLTRAGAGTPVTGASVSEAIASALAGVGPDGKLKRAEVQPVGLADASPKPNASAPVYRRWWFWTALGAAGVASIFAVQSAREEEPRLRVIVR